MNAINLIIGEYVHRLPIETDEATVLGQLTDAIRAGGGVVDLPTVAAQGTVAVLISPGVAIFVERTPMPDDDRGAVDDAYGVGVWEWPSL